jgi:hypothetical protein
MFVSVTVHTVDGGKSNCFDSITDTEHAIGAGTSAVHVVCHVLQFFAVVVTCTSVCAGTSSARLHW